jgi:uncharacterized protein (DUF934 family)
MMTLIKNGNVVEDPFIDCTEMDILPKSGALIVSVAQWQDHWEKLVRRPDPIGVQLKSHEHPEIISDDLESLTVIALEFPTFKDGRAYSYARLLRERYGFTGELRAVGDVLPDQIHFMERVGFNSVEIDSDNALADFERATKEFTVWYQPSGDARQRAAELRRGQKQG